MSQDERESAPAQQPVAADNQPAPPANASADNELAMQGEDTQSGRADPAKAETAVVAQAPFETRVMFEDEEWSPPEASAPELSAEEMAERAHAEEDMRQRREAARLDEEQKRIADAKALTVINNPSWPVLPSEETKTYDFSATQMVAEMNASHDDAPPPAPSAFAAVVPTQPPPPPEEPEVDIFPMVIEEPQQIMGPDQTFDAFVEYVAPPPVAPAPAPSAVTTSAVRRPPKARRAKPRGVADWIHTYRLPIITFLMGVVVGVFIAFLV